MADLLQRVFLVFVRPYFVDSTGHNVYHTGPIYAKVGVNQYGNTEYAVLTTNNSTGGNAPVKINSEGKYKADPWFLHSSYTSYNKMREELKSLIASYGTDNVRVTVYVPIDYEVLPNQ